MQATPQAPATSSEPFAVASGRRVVNDFSIQVATVNGSGSQTANTVLMVLPQVEMCTGPAQVGVYTNHTSAFMGDPLTGVAMQLSNGNTPLPMTVALAHASFAGGPGVNVTFRVNVPNAPFAPETRM